MSGSSPTRTGGSLWWLVPWSQLCRGSVENSARAPSQRSSFLACASLMGLLGLLHIRWLNLRCECRKRWKLSVSYSISTESGTVLLLLNPTGQRLRLKVSLKTHHTDPQCYGIWRWGSLGRLGHKGKVLINEMNPLIKETSLPSHHVGTPRKDGSLWIWRGLCQTPNLLSPWSWTPQPPELWEINLLFKIPA